MLRIRIIRTSFLCCWFFLFVVATHGQQNAGSIAGQTLGPDGKPVSGVSVSLIRLPTGAPAGPQTPLQTISDAEGKFTFAMLIPGDYAIRTQQTGYLSSAVVVRRGSSSLQAGTTSITLTAGQHIGDYTIGLVPEGTLSGTITGDGAALVRVQVIAFRKAFNGDIATAGGVSDDQGQFKLTGLLPGRYYLLSLPQGESVYPPAHYPEKTSADGARTIDIAEGQQRTGVDIHLRTVPSFHIRGKVQNHIDADAHFQILCSPAGNDPYIGFAPKVAMVKPDGSFEVSGISTGSWLLATMSVHGLARLTGVTTVKVEDHDIADIVATANAPVDIKGSVRVIPEGAALPPMAQLFLQPLGVRVVSGVRAVIAPDGSFTLPAVAPAHYALNMTLPPRGFLKSVKLGDREMAASDVDAGNPSGTLQLVASMASGEIDGTVTLSDGKPVAGAAVTIAPDPDRPDRTDLYRSVRASDDGVFAFPGLAPGKYRLFAASALDSANFNILPESLKLFDDLATTVTLEDGGKVQTTVREITDTKSGR